VHQKSREKVIERQQQEMMELSTPVVELWRGILALPLIGTLDSQRTQVVMENLLQKIADTGAPIAIIDITGVPTVDTLVAPAPAQNHRRRPADGRRLHHPAGSGRRLRRPSSTWEWSWAASSQIHPGRRLRGRLEENRPRRLQTA